MKLLFAALEYPAGTSGGIGVFYRTLARALRRRGVDVSVVYEDPRNRAIRGESRGRVETLAPGRTGGPGVAAVLWRRARLSRCLRRQAALWKPDLVETHDWAGPLIVAPGRPLLVRRHGANTPRRLALGQPASRLWRRLEGRTLALADASVAVSEIAARTTSEAFGLGGPCAVAPNGVDADRFRPPLLRPKSQEILYVGSLRPDKGLRELFVAARRVLVRHPGARLTLVGPEPDETFASSLLDGLPPPLRTRVRRVGSLAREDLVERYGGAAVCVFPSLFEAFGLTCLEALSCGAAVVGARGTGHEEMIADGVNGRLVDPRDAAALSDAVEESLSSPERRVAYGEAARRTVLERFTLDRVLDHDLTIYERLIRGKRPAGRRRAWAA